MKLARTCLYLILLTVALVLGAYFFALVSAARTIVPISANQSTKPQIQPDIRRALGRSERVGEVRGRVNAYAPKQNRINQIRKGQPKNDWTSVMAPAQKSARKTIGSLSAPPISPGTALSRVLNTSQVSLVSSAGTDEGFVDTTLDLISDQRTTFDNAGGSFDIAVGQSGARYEVYSATLQNENVGVLVVGLDTNADYVGDSSATFDLEADFDLPSAAAVVTGTAKSGREFVVVCSSGYYNSSNPNDPFNEPSPGVILLVRDANGTTLTAPLARWSGR